MPDVRKRDRGFTLLEVMISLAIVAIALVALLGLANRSVMTHTTIQKLTRATMLAQQLMSEQEVNVSGSQTSWEPQEDVFAEPFADFRWRISYQDTLIRQMKQVTVVVLWGGAAQNEKVELVSFLPLKGGG